MENQPPTPPITPLVTNGLSQADERMWAMFAHLSAIPGSFFVIGSILAPLIIWQVQKDKSAFVDYHGKEALNFQITIAIAFAISLFLMLILIGIVLVWIVGVAWLVFTIIGGIKANSGEYYRYPFTIRFIK